MPRISFAILSRKNKLRNQSEKILDDCKEDNKKKAKILCIQKRFEEARAIYEKFIDNDLLDMDGYMGLIRVESENYKKFEGEELDEAIQVAKDICGEDDLSQYDPDYGKYVKKRNEYSEKVREDRKKAEREKYNVGNIVVFGRYWQAKERSNGKTPIEWIVLKREKDRALLLSRYCLDCKQYSIVTK